MRLVHSIGRRAGVAAAVAGIAIAGLVAAPAASATPPSVVANCAVGAGLVQESITVPVGGTFVAAASGQDCWLADLDGILDVDPNYQFIPVGTSETFTVSANAPLGDHVVSFVNFGDGLDLTITVVPAVAAAPAPVPATMSLQLGEGAGAAVCANDAPVGYTGTWMTLPGQADCHKADAPNAKLLGWSTSAAFPVAIAQRQANNGWGTYELTDADGNVTAIFIPAGWGTFVTGANSLYPIWSA